MTQQADAPKPWAEKTIKDEAESRDAKIGDVLNEVRAYFLENFPEIGEPKLRLLPLIARPTATQPSVINDAQSNVVEKLLQAYASNLREPGAPVPTDASFIEAAAASGYVRTSVIEAAKQLSKTDDINDVTVRDVLSVSKQQLADAGFRNGLGLMGHRAGELARQSPATEQGL